MTASRQRSPSGRLEVVKDHGMLTRRVSLFLFFLFFFYPASSYLSPSSLRGKHTRAARGKPQLGSSEARRRRRLSRAAQAQMAPAGRGGGPGSEAGRDVGEAEAGEAAAAARTEVTMAQHSADSRTGHGGGWRLSAGVVRRGKAARPGQLAAAASGGLRPAREAGRCSKADRTR